MMIPWNDDIGDQVLRLAGKYRDDPAFRKEAERDSWAVVRQLPPEEADLIARRVGDRDLKVHFNTAETLYVVFPGSPSSDTQTLDADDLSAIAGGGCASTVGSVGSFGTVPSTASTGGTIGSASSKG